MDIRNCRFVAATALAVAASTLAASCSFDYEPRSDRHGGDSSAAASTTSPPAAPTSEPTPSDPVPASVPSTTATPSTARATSPAAATPASLRRFRLPEPPRGYLAPSVEIDEATNYTVVYPTTSNGEARSDGARLSIESLVPTGQDPAKGHEVIGTHAVRDTKPARFFRVAQGRRYGMTWTEDASSAITIYAAESDPAFYIEIAAALQG